MAASKRYIPIDETQEVFNRFNYDGSPINIEVKDLDPDFKSRALVVTDCKSIEHTIWIPRVGREDKQMVEFNTGDDARTIASDFQATLEQFGYYDIKFSTGDGCGGIVVRLNDTQKDHRVYFAT